MDTTGFFRKTAVLAAPAILSAQSPNNTVRVAFIGVGNRGSYLLRHMPKVPGVTVVAICDINQETLGKVKAEASAAGGLSRRDPHDCGRGQES